MSLIIRDKKTIWHPYTPFLPETFPIPIVKGEKEFVFDEQGNKYFDAVSSWWVNIHGHSHPYIAQKVYEQFCRLEHIIFAGYTHLKAIELAERLLEKLQHNYSKVFYSDNGSTAVEVALKIALQYWKNAKQNKIKIIAYEDAYHGDTFGSMSVSGRSLFNSAFESLLFDVIHIPTPTENQEEKSLEALLDALKNKDIAAFIFEPLVLGAGGMVMYSKKILIEMISLCKQHDVICIADEVMTGFGRTGNFFATDVLSQKPDIICLSKGITGGSMPLGATVIAENIINGFISDNPANAFYHGHSYTANPLACAAACASLDLFDQNNVMENDVARITNLISNKIQKLNNKNLKIRQTGTIAAFEFVTTDKTSYINKIKDKIRNHFLKHNIIVRPLGNILYIIPPYCTSNESIDKFFAVMEGLYFKRV